MNEEMEKLTTIYHGPTELSATSPPVSISSAAWKLRNLDNLLHHRAVSSPADEPICIGTLLRLPPNPILSCTSAEDRMAKLWHLVYTSIGIPTHIIFFGIPTLSNPGFRWAPSTFLDTKAYYGRDERRNRWLFPPTLDLGKLTPIGLVVTYPGIKLQHRKHSDGLPQQPWEGINRVPEYRLVFQDPSTNMWFQVITAKRAIGTGYWTDEERRAYDLANPYPLQAAIGEGNCAVVLREELAPSTGTRSIRIGLVVRISDGSAAEALKVHGVSRVLVTQLLPGEALLVDVAKGLATELRASALTRTLVAISDRESEEYKKALDDVREEMKRRMQEEIKKNSDIERAAEETMGRNMNDSIWVLVADWYNHDVFGEALPPLQKWIVD
jgi:hypothetical protein